MNLIASLFLLDKHKQIWLWPSCNNHPKTLSFRAITHHMNPTNKDSPDLTTLGSFFTNSSEYSPSVSTESDSSAVETIVRGARSERLFFEPDTTSSILEIQGGGAQCTSSESGGAGGLPYKESVAVEMETEDPYDEFKKSMEEMVEIYGLKDWDCLEELLVWYLRMNEKANHEFIVGAFFDLLAGISSGGGGGDAGGGGGELSFLTSGSSTCSSPNLSTSGI
ncbi:hypothetical protein R6Q59_008716 [Mikania micrantha]|uniref:Transcription repressor n=1 Tax=Mikania micrantha TaxID=192012 RepID=A0A5N6Q5E9_9ASTR|nr:hypothetical protein E3N88_03021 [Mikania micrantha]